MKVNEPKMGKRIEQKMFCILGHWGAIRALQNIFMPMETPCKGSSKCIWFIKLTSTLFGKTNNTKLMNQMNFDVFDCCLWKKFCPTRLWVGLE
jgi:hypothetical protein